MVTSKNLNNDVSKDSPIGGQTQDQTTALDSSLTVAWFFLTNHNSLLSIATNQFASFWIDNRLRQSAIFVSVKVAKFEIKIKGFFLYILILYYIKQIDSMLPFVCSVIHHRGRQNVVRTSVTHSDTPRVPLFYCYWTDAQQHGIYLLNIFTLYHFLTIYCILQITTVPCVFRLFHFIAMFCIFGCDGGP